MRSIIGAIVSLIVSGQAEAAEFWEKTWIISAIEGSADDRRLLAPTIGREIVLSRAHIVDPLSSDCEAGADISDIRARPAGEIARHFGGVWNWPKSPHKEEVFGWARCDGTNIGAFAFPGPNAGYLFYENGVIVHLK